MNVAPSEVIICRNHQPRSVARARRRRAPQMNKKMPSRARP
jgi:hypothetical protein